MGDPHTSACAGCGRTQAHTRNRVPSGMVAHEARGLCANCYGNKRNRARLVAVMTAPQPLRDQVEQAVARGWRPSRIMRELAVDYDTYRRIRDAMDATNGGDTA